MTRGGHEPPEPFPGRRFGSTEHLASEAIAAFVDNELRTGAFMRAASHLSLCPECSADVDAQRQARIELRRAADVAMPASLLGALSAIPHSDFAAYRADMNLTFESRRWSLFRRK